MKSILLILLISCATISFSQNNRTPKKLGTNLAIRAGVGLDKTFYTEYGLSLFSNSKIKKHSISKGNWHYAVYTTFINRLKKDENISVTGLKLGLETSNILAKSIEFTYYWNSINSKTEFIFTPKIGYSYLGWINIFYGYNLTTREKPLNNIIRRHQFSISSNLNLGMLPKRKKHS